VNPELPLWLHLGAEASLLLALLCAVVIIADEFARPQHMWVMNLVWPLCALFGSVIWLLFYFRFERGMPRGDEAGSVHMQSMQRPKPPFWAMAVTSASHCGAGCMLGDILAETLAFFVPAIAVAFGWKSLFAEKTFAVWILDFVFAFVLGIGFQYFTIKPLRHLSSRDGLIEALKADTATVVAWQIGMYGFMALAQFGWFAPAYGAPLEVNRPEFWLMMQIAMLCGFITSYPINWLLLKAGIKEGM
jgi:hypothetical protein